MATYYWRGSTGAFDQSSGWQIADAYGVLSPASLAPDAADVVVFDTTGIALSADSAFAGLLQLDLPSTAGGLNLGGHTLTLLSTAQLGDVSSAIIGAGTLETDAITAVPGLESGGAALQLGGGATWSNAGLVVDGGIVALGTAAGDSAAMINQAGALFALATDQIGQISPAGPGAFSFINSGTLAKSGGTGLSSLTVPVTNTGVIDAASGTLELDAGGMLGGMIGGDAGQVRLAGSFTLPAGLTQSVAFASGVQFGGAANGRAILSGPGTLASSGPVRLTDWAGTQVVLTGGATWTNSGSVTAAADLAFGATAGDSGTLMNQAGAAFTFATDASMTAATTGSYSLCNAGTLSKTGGTGISRIGVPVTDTGSVAVASGTLEIDAGGTFAGPMTGAGTLAFGGGTSLLGAVVGVDVAVTGGTLTSSGSTSFRNGLQIVAGVAALNTQTTANAIVQTGGTLTGSGTLTAWGGGSLVGGLQTGTGTTQLLGGSIGGVAVDGGRTVENNGALTWSSGSIVLGGGDSSLAVHAGTLTNAGVLRVTAATVIGPAGGGSGVVDNTGVMIFDPGAGETSVDAALLNRSVLQVLSGTLSLNGGGSSLGSTLLVNAAATLRFGASVPGGAGGVFHITGGTYGAANTVVDGGTLDLSAATGFAPATSVSLDHAGLLALGRVGATAGTLAVNGGAMLSGSGRVTVTGTALLGDSVQTGAGTTALRGASSIDGAVRLDGGRMLENDGTLVWNGGLVSLGSGDAGAAIHAGTLSNAAGALLQVATDGTIAVPGTGAVVNAGMLVKSAGTGTALVAAGFTNNGTVAVQSGTLSLGNAVGGSGTFLIEGARLDFAGIVGGGETIRFIGGGGGGTLALEGAGAFAAPVSGFAAGDALDLAAISFAAHPTLGFAAGDGGGTLTISDGTHSVAMSLQGSFVAGGFSLGSDGHGGVLAGYSSGSPLL